ncbi:MAG: glucosaminidase domain-containing protein [Candidatus Sedimenticola sp. (ex Thyasira tokunagai)]
MKTPATISIVTALLLAVLSLASSAYQPGGFQRAGYAPAAGMFRQNALPYGYYPVPTPRYLQPYDSFGRQPTENEKTAPAPRRPVAKSATVEKPLTSQTNSGAEKTNVVKKAKPSTVKSSFIETLVPLINEENGRLRLLRKSVLHKTEQLNQGKKLSTEESQQLSTLAVEYRIKGDPINERSARDALIEKIDIIPLALTLAQAANESAWGKSRFAREGNNLFGIWTFDRSKGIIPKGREQGKKHLVRKFDTLGESVRYYMYSLNSHPAYQALRKIRSQQRASAAALDSRALANGLEKYSAKGKEYVRLIQQIIEQNKNYLASLERGQRQA